MGLMYFRLYVTQSLLSYLFGLDEGNVSREINQRLRPRLLEVLPVPMRDTLLMVADQGTADQGTADQGTADQGTADQGTADQGTADQGTADKSRRRIGTLADLLAAHPELGEVFVDATEQEVPKPKTKTREGVPQPEGKTARKIRYSGKQKKHTVKTQVLTTKALVLHMLGGLPGSVHDHSLLRASGVLRHLPPRLPVRVDRGYEGVEAEYPEVSIEKPVRRKRGQILTPLGRAYNQVMSRLRVPVEHVLSRLQKFRVLSGVYRGRWAEHEDTFCVVSGLVNFKALGALTWA